MIDGHAKNGISWTFHSHHEIFEVGSMFKSNNTNVNNIKNIHRQ